jgi:probable phosphoglycerate mutase
LSNRELWLVRHGETEWNAGGRWQGHADVELSHAGREQAQRLAARLAGEDFTAVYSSDLVRASETARAVALRLADRLPVRLEPRLREIDVGRMSGLTTAEGLEQGINARGLAYDEPWPGGESRKQLVDRVAEALAVLTARHPEGRLLLFGHGGTIGAALMTLLGLSNDEFHRVFGRIGNTSVSRLAPDRGGLWRATVFNDTAHLEGAWRPAHPMDSDAPAPELEAVP